MKREIKTGSNTSMGFDDEKIRTFESIDAWRAEGERLFGQDVTKWKYKCPMCGHIAAVQDFIDAGLDGQEAANSAYCECIGRYTGKGSPKKGDSSGCNWAGYGLFGIPHGGVVVMTGEGSGQHIFEFAEVE